MFSSIAIASHMPYLSHLYEIMALFVLRKLILQTCMRSHPVGLDVWDLVGPFVYFHISCVRTAKALARLRRCAGSPEPSLVACVISTIISWAGSFILFVIELKVEGTGAHWYETYHKMCYFICICDIYQIVVCTVESPTVKVRSGMMVVIWHVSVKMLRLASTDAIRSKLRFNFNPSKIRHLVKCTRAFCHWIIEHIEINSCPLLFTVRNGHNDHWDFTKFS